MAYEPIAAALASCYASPYNAVRKSYLRRGCPFPQTLLQVHT